MLPDDLQLVGHFLRELLTRDHQYERTPEPELMLDPQSVREYRDAVQPEGAIASIHLLNLIMLCRLIRPGMKVVDLACGPAALLMEVAKLHPQANFVGVDLSGEMLSWAERHRASEDLHNVELVRADITRLDFLAPASVDLVVSTLALHHLADEAMLARCFEEAARVLKPGGDLYLQDFASLKRRSSTDYFVRERTRDLPPYLAMDYEASLKAAFRLEAFQRLMPRVSAAVPKARLRWTFGVPFFVVVSSAGADGVLAPAQQQAVADYWRRMKPRQRKDFEDLRRFFRLNGLSMPHPERDIAGRARR